MDAAGLVFGQRGHAVVANPPYIVAPTPEARDAYRARYVSAHGKFGMGAPFTERLFELTVDGGFIAQITSNAFMKREYGKPLVEEVLPYYDLTHVVDTSGAYIPGHGTPTVILVARNRAPTGKMVRAALGKRGEPSKPKGVDPLGTRYAAELGKLHRELAKHLAPGRTPDEAGSLAGLWITTAAATQALAWRLGRYEGSSLPSGSLGALFDFVADTTPHNDFFNRDDGVNPIFAEPSLPAAWDARIRAEVEQVVGFCTIDTDWIGDLYQGLDHAAVKRHAFCQTPAFVGEFLLRHAVDPALEEFGEGATVCDPACGTGHLLVAAFRRLYLHRADPVDSGPEYTYPTCARMALDQLRGADLNPVAAALCRWRLMLAYLDASQPRHLGLVPDDLPIHVAVCDALTERRGPKRIDHAKRWPAAEVQTLPKPLREQLALFAEAV